MEARFTTGRPIRHVAVMTATSGVGLVSLFLVDALNLFYVSMLGEQALAAAIGFAGTVQFFMISVAIGLSIAATAVVSRAVGAGEAAEARRLAASSLAVLVGALALVALGLWIMRDAALGLLGAEGETRAIAGRFLAIVLPALPLLGVGMVAGGLMRAVGDARRSMQITLAGGAVAAVLDPLLIFGLGLGIDGAAIASALSRTTLAVVGLHYLVRVHGLLGRIERAHLAADARRIFGIGLPAVATQLSTPFGNAFLTGTVAQHGDAAVAGWAVVGRLSALAFGAVFAMSGAVGPIIGQNRGAGLMARVRETHRDALLFAGGYVLCAWAALFLATPWIVAGFGLTGGGVAVVEAFTGYGAGAFLFTAALFVSNAAFNNLGRPVWATAFNWSRDGVAIPALAALLGGAAGASGVVAIQATAAVLVGTAAALAARAFVLRLAARAEAEAEAESAPRAATQPAFATGRTALAQIDGAGAAAPLAEEDTKG
jgi:putative MATE family efflux protein